MSKILTAILCLWAVAACTRRVDPPKTDPGTGVAGAVDPAAAATWTVTGPGAQPSGYVATNKADPNCPGCVGPDAVAPTQYYGRPDMKLDPQTLGEVQASIDTNNTLIEGGIDILEKNAKTPEKALADMEGYLKEHARAIDAAHIKAAEIRARLRVVGYDQDIPAEIRPGFEERMGKISERLERMREIYATRREVLAAFGRLFPRGK